MLNPCGKITYIFCYRIWCCTSCSAAFSNEIRTECPPTSKCYWDSNLHLDPYGKTHHMERYPRSNVQTFIPRANLWDNSISRANDGATGSLYFLKCFALFTGAKPQTPCYKGPCPLTPLSFRKNCPIDRANYKHSTCNYYKPRAIFNNAPGWLFDNSRILIIDMPGPFATAKAIHGP